MLCLMTFSDFHLCCGCNALTISLLRYRALQTILVGTSYCLDVNYLVSIIEMSFMKLKISIIFTVLDIIHRPVFY
jgi:hypothetical protein